MMLVRVLLVVLLVVAAHSDVHAQAAGELRVDVRDEGRPVVGAAVSVGSETRETDAAGSAVLTLPAGSHMVHVSADGYVATTAQAVVRTGVSSSISIELEPIPEFEEEIIVSSTRAERRVEDLPMRVEVVPGEEVQEKIMMTPGDVSMLLNETNGLRVQTTSPSLGGAGVRIQGLRSRYTQVLADGLPLYGGQTGSIGLLQIPPMDLGQVEVIKGVASALYGMSAIGGVINLVSRRPTREREAELLVNQTSHAGLDLVPWIASPIGSRWGYTFLGGVHLQRRSDLDADGWVDLPHYQRVTARPRLFWNDGNGTSLLLTAGGMNERRRGGTTASGLTPDGSTVEERLDSTRFDAGIVARMPAGPGRTFSVRGSVTTQHHTHVFGRTVERDRHGTSFGEASFTAATGRHVWVAGAALQRDAFRSRDVARFDFVHWIPGVFVQDDIPLGQWLTVSMSGRLDRHSEFGAFASPRISALIRPLDPWTVRLSAGGGYYAPTPFTEETDATGLGVVTPLDRLEPERARSLSADVTWARAPIEVTATFFTSRIEHALTVVDTTDAVFPLRIVNAAGPTTTRGTELIARFHREGFDIIATHMYLDAREHDPIDGPRRVPLNPRHSASFDLLRQIGPARIGFEVFFTGEQPLEDNPYRTTGTRHVLWGGLIDWALGGGSRLYVNIENIGDVRQTKNDPLVLPTRRSDGRWTVDAWAPLEGRTVNGGIRWKF